MFIAKVSSLFFVFMLMGCRNSVSQPSNTIQSKSSDNSEISLQMERTGCFGHCPAYQLNVETTGKFLFNGIQDTRIKGKAEDYVSKEKMSELITEIEKADFFSLKDSYTSVSDNCPSWETDAPTVILSVNLNGKKKVIKHNLGCTDVDSSGKAITDKTFPQQLYNLENKIDEIVETKRWIGEQK